MDKKLKVLIISPCGLPVPAVKGGAVLNLIDSLIVQNEGHALLDMEVAGIYNRDAVKKSTDYPNTRFIFLKPPLLAQAADNFIYVFEKLLKKTSHDYFRKLYVLSKLKRLLKKGDYDRVVFENAGYLLRVLKDKEIAEKYRGRLFYHVHNDIPNNIYVDGVKQCKLLVISDYLSIKIKKLCGESVADNIAVLRNGFDCAPFSRDLSDSERLSLKRGLGIDENKKIVVFAGRISPTKGIEQLVDAFEILERDDTVLLVVGSHNFGSSSTSVFAKRMEKRFDGLGDKVCFTGFVPHGDVGKYYALADVAVLPSMWEEPMGLTIAEAMCAALPVITTDAGGIPEFIDERYGIILKRDSDIVENIKKSINTVLDNPDEWRERGKSAREHILPMIDETAYYMNFAELLRGL